MTRGGQVRLRRAGAAGICAGGRALHVRTAPLVCHALWHVPAVQYPLGAGLCRRARKRHNAAQNSQGSPDAAATNTPRVTRRRGAEGPDCAMPLRTPGVARGTCGLHFSALHCPIWGRGRARGPAHEMHTPRAQCDRPPGSRASCTSEVQRGMAGGQWRGGGAGGHHLNHCRVPRWCGRGKGDGRGCLDKRWAAPVPRVPSVREWTVLHARLLLCVHAHMHTCTHRRLETHMLCVGGGPKVYVVRQTVLFCCKHFPST